jgi:preprotein translocase subunit SecG
MQFGLIFLTIIHVIVCLFLIGVVLLQSGKAADLAGAFGGMGSQTAFGPRGAATALSRATTASAIIFMLTSILLSVVATRSAGTGGGATVLDRTAPRQSTIPTDPNAGRPTVTVQQEGTTPRTVPLPLEVDKQGRAIPPGTKQGEAPKATAPPAEKK